MKHPADFTHILLYRHFTDMRKQILGLSSLVEELLPEYSLSKTLFVFCNRKKDIVKALYFDKAGFCLWTKKLDQSKFPWLKQALSQKHLTISAQDMELLLDGVDVFKRHKKLDFSSLS